MENDFEFEFGRNVEFRKVVESWKNQENEDCFILTSSIACGKTLLLCELQEELPKAEDISG